MNDTEKKENSFIGYEYREITVDIDMEAMYADGYENFGWKLDSTSNPQIGINTITMKFKRDRKIRNKAELTRLQRQFDACISEITSMEKSKNARAITVSLGVGLIGTAFMAGATFAYLGGLIILCVILAIPGFIGWGLPYFLYNSSYAKKAEKVAPLIEGKYDEIYKICEKANSLLGN